MLLPIFKGSTKIKYNEQINKLRNREEDVGQNTPHTREDSNEAWRLLNGYKRQ